MFSKKNDKKKEKTPSKVAQKYEFMFKNIADRPTVGKTGGIDLTPLKKLK